MELCHRRIYKENLDSLWDGEVEKLPTLESIEADRDSMPYSMAYFSSVMAHFGPDTSLWSCFLALLKLGSCLGRVQ